MATVFLGNNSPREVPEGTQVRVNDRHVSGDEGQSIEGKTIVVIETPDFDLEGKKIGLGKKLTEIKNAFRVHSVEGVPAWVEAHDSDFAQLIADEFDAQVGRPSDWDPEEELPLEEQSREATAPNGDSFLTKVDEFLSDNKKVNDAR